MIRRFLTHQGNRYGGEERSYWKITADSGFFNMGHVVHVCKDRAGGVSAICAYGTETEYSCSGVGDSFYKEAEGA